MTQKKRQTKSKTPAETIGEKIREARLRAGLTQAQAAEAAGIAPSHLCVIEHGREPKPSTLRAVAAALGCEVEIMLRPTGKPTAKKR